ncbi:MAG TPA: condensation domain-containing protein, partial [Longimicrobium sp.]
MTEVNSSAGLSRLQKQELLRKILAERRRPRTEPASYAQERLWFLDRLEPGSSTYNIPVAWRLGGALDEPALERALGEIVRRHEALRTTFADRDGTPVQVVAPFGGFTLSIDDLSQLADADREAEARRRADREARRPFDLAAGPLFRAALLRLGDEDHVLLLSMHHIVSDGWSLEVLFRELSSLYEAYREGRDSPLAELPVQYADYAAWQREQLEGESLNRQLSYWKERLAGAPRVLDLPTDRPRPAVRTHRGATVWTDLSAKVLERLQALGRSEGATLYMTLLGALQVLLGKYAGSEDVVVGSPIAGRTRGEVEELIGFFVNTLVLRTDLGGDPSFREVLRRVREATLGAYEHQELPFEKLVVELQPERSLSHTPLFQVMFELQKDAGGGGGGALPGLSMRAAGAELASAQFDLALDLAATPRGLRGGLTYSTDLFERGTAERMLGHLERVLEQAAANADVRLSRLDLLGEAERALVLEEWNRTERPFPDGCIHQLFQAQAERTPHAAALVWGPEELTYRELDARANRLARRLRGLGVGPDVLVGLCAERSLELVVGVLGILKAG